MNASRRGTAPMRPTQLLRTSLLSAFCALAAAQEGVPRRGPPRGPIKEDKSTFFGKEGDQSRSVRQSTGGPRPRRRRGRALHAVERSHAPSRRRRTQTCHITRRSQREASPFTQFALTGCALLLVGLGLLQIFGTMVTVKARDDTKKKQ